MAAFASAHGSPVMRHVINVHRIDEESVVMGETCVKANDRSGMHMDNGSAEEWCLMITLTKRKQGSRSLTCIYRNEKKFFILLQK